MSGIGHVDHVGVGISDCHGPVWHMGEFSTVVLFFVPSHGFGFLFFLFFPPTVLVFFFPFFLFFLLTPLFMLPYIIMDLPIFVIAEWATLLVDIRCPRGGS